MRKFQLTIIALLLCIIGKSQSNETNNDWKIISQDENVSFSTQKINCERPQDGLFAEYVLVKLENKTNKAIIVTWYTDTYYNNYCTNCDHSLRDTKRTYTLKPKEVVVGNCAPGLNIGLKMFSKWLKMENDRILTNYEITEISSNPAQ